MDGFESAYLKLDRASALNESVQKATSDWSDSLDLTMSAATEPSTKGEGFDVVVRLHGIKPVPASLSIELDECLHHIRSSLDHAVWQLVKDHGGALDRQAFPIFEKSPPPKQMAVYIAGLPDKTVEVIKAIQPYNGPKGPKASKLWWVHKLDIAAKHQSVVPLASGVSQVHIRIPDDDIGGKKIYLPQFAATDSDSATLVRVRGVRQDYVPLPPEEWTGYGEERRLVLFFPALDAPKIPPPLKELTDWIYYVRRTIARLEQER